MAVLCPPSPLPRIISCDALELERKEGGLGGGGLGGAGGLFMPKYNLVHILTRRKQGRYKGVGDMEWGYLLVYTCILKNQ